ncbi:MAG: 3-deoxy-manno-octulosonate cytidylyltransferase [Paludibacteraceae bacterium]|nr:3-deoxy-manno-octulosonate cytidylyltransferase [Paludibacteraceae bacterium]
MNFVGIIPARYASTRFPGKPLADIGGKPMIQRVYEQVKKVLDEVTVATDSDLIYACVRAFGGNAVMTSPDHKCGTERCAEAWEKTACGRKDADCVVVNIQGDEPFIQPEQIRALCGCFDNKTEIATLVKPFTANDTLQDLENPNTPKVVFAEDGRALMFSRSVIPYLRGLPKEEWLGQGRHFRHIGMYAYRADVLKEIIKLPLSPAEQAESLEQLRWLEHGYRIQVAVCETASLGIDTPADLEKARLLLAAQTPAGDADRQSAAI